MNKYRLTDTQKQLLRQLVELKREGKLQEPIGTATDMSGTGLFWNGGVLEPGGDVIGDLLALRNAGLMHCRRNTFASNWLCSITQAGYDAVDNDFRIPSSQTTPSMSIGTAGAVIMGMSGGSIQAVGEAQGAEISQIVNDPGLLQSQVELLTEKLLDTVKPELGDSQQIQYAENVQELKEQLLAEEPSASVLKQLVGRLAFLADIEGAIALVARAWPYIYPLLVIAAEKLGQ
jgi:hypothetical protein